MLATYVFALRSEIKVEDANWSCVSFERDGKRISIQKPFPRTRFDWNWDSLTMHSRTPPPKEYFEFLAGEEEFDTSLVTIGVAPTSDVDEEALYSETRETALSVLQEVTSWIRVLTRQYWVGRSGRSFQQQKWVMYIDEGKRGKPRHTGGAGWGFEYGKDLDATTWAEIGTRLALGERPRPSQLFFCDALLDVVEGDLAQAVAALGVSCETELSALTQALLARKSAEFQRLFGDYVKPRFQDTFELLRRLGCVHLKDFDKLAYDVVLRLYEARGKAVHRGEPYFEMDGEKLFITRTEIPKYVDAVEKLFVWSEAQRSKLFAGVADIAL